MLGKGVYGDCARNPHLSQIVRFVPWMSADSDDADASTRGRIFATAMLPRRFHDLVHDVHPGVVGHDWRERGSKPHFEGDVKLKGA